MADFSARITSSFSIREWADDRLNPLPGLPHRYISSRLYQAVTVKCTATGGAEGADDATLGGRLFLGWIAEAPSAIIPPMSSPVSHSSVLIFTPGVLGHYLFVVRRPQGGGVAIHLSVEA